MDSRYYLEYYALEREHWWFRARLDILRSQLADLPVGNPSRILNIGIATGATSTMLQEFGTVKSVEYDRDCFEFVKTRLPELDLDQASILDLPYAENTYDLVCAFDVIEHVEDDAKAVAEMMRVCRPGGHVFVTVPAFMFLWSRHDEVNHHHRRYTRAQLRQRFATGGRIVFSSYFNFALFPAVAGFRWLSRHLPQSFGRKSGESGSDFSVHQPGLLSRIFYRLMRGERQFLRRGIAFPWGVSLLLVFRKSQ